MTSGRLKVHHVALAIVLACAAACSPSSQQKAISATLTACNAASAAFVAFDASHQQALVAQATTDAAGQAALASWRVEQAKIAALITNTYKLVATAATAVTTPNVDNMVAAAAALAAELEAAGIRGPSL